LETGVLSNIKAFYRAVQGKKEMDEFKKNRGTITKKAETPIDSGRKTGNSIMLSRWH
jgi:hypothetical protein